MEQERENNLDKITDIYSHLLNQEKKKNLLNIRIKNTITHWVYWLDNENNK